MKYQSYSWKNKKQQAKGIVKNENLHGGSIRRAMS